jgi:predicted anti-sigma-YlaC factor YlaD
MKHKHVRKLFLEWFEGRLNSVKKIRIEKHLMQCSNCRVYYRRLSEIIDVVDLSDFKILEPDPYLPTRIPSTMKENKYPILPWDLSCLLHRIVATIILIICLGFGVFIGTRFGETSLEDNDIRIVDAYYQVLMQESVSDNWASLLEVEGE